MRSVAEWVEDVDTLRALQEIGVDYVQGFLIARPQESSAILAASSAASFVKDPEVISFVEGLSEPAQANVFDYEWHARASGTH
jgi:c-di-GMP-related signal transduction protein